MSTQVPAGGSREDAWAKPVTHLEVGAVEGADSGTVQGRRLSGPIQGFGKLWQKTYTVAIPGEGITPEHVIAEWRANYGSFWPESNRFYAPLTGIKPGEVGLITGKAGGLTLSTGVLVLYADDVSFTFMTPEGHPFAGMITFSAFAGPDGVTVAQVSLLIRAQDPLVDLGMVFGGHKKEDRIWQHTLGQLASHFGVEGQVDTLIVCVDKKRQWKRFGNVRHDAAIYAVTKPFRRRGLGTGERQMTTAAADPTGVAGVQQRVARRPYSIVGAAGLGLVAATLAVWLVAGALTGMGEDLAFFAVLLAIPTVAAVLEWRFGTWAAVVGLVASLLVGLGMFWTVFGLSTPASFLDFVGGVTIPLGALVGVGGSVAAIAKRRHVRDEAVVAREQRVLRVVAAIVVLAAVASAIATFAGREQVDAAAASGAVDVGMAGSVFSPATIEADAGGTILVRNDDAFAHNFAVPALGIEAVAVNPGSSKLVELGDAATGTYTAYCTLHSDTDVSDPAEAGMAATLIVK